MKAAHAQTIIQAFEAFSPKNLAVEGDKIGLQIGTLNKPVEKVMVTLDVLEPVVDEAIEQGVSLIIAHHPIIFRPLQNLRTDQAAGRTIEKLIKHDIAVYVAHTNLDVADGGVNDLMAEALGLTSTQVLAETTVDRVKKLSVFAPVSHAEVVREAIGDAGAGKIGDYSHCSFQTEGTGMFVPSNEADPFIGEKGELARVDEVKIESVFYESQQSEILRALKQAHPYEEPAYDIFVSDIKGKSRGLGRIGYLEQEMTLDAFIDHVKGAFAVKGARAVGDKSKPIKKVAVLGGDGNKYLRTAIQKGADAYVTGDLYFHVAHDAMIEGLACVDPGHHVEKIMKQAVADKLRKFITSKKYDTEIIVSNIQTDPFWFK
ncbi:Nif3-like dinuclear metal center hexameric protein [Paenalkalicoccus suaedae]|uniref:GTP cyclohydrolase 1 type 2 homolog n=1 Tax=Paenalkalicoccus suaedae TaxID=2592382 RepID=A0A859FCT6_9BACI|nr:Nif3-like dinuclear metal center hexameric protein [Paenalkalicoccus suaedae]QKS70877.1 Nif3-like dinuclear metal center hexameric protein [Paenalkalicoccus suaedae]